MNPRWHRNRSLPQIQIFAIAWIMGTVGTGSVLAHERVCTGDGTTTCEVNTDCASPPGPGGTCVDVPSSPDTAVVYVRDFADNTCSETGDACGSGSCESSSVRETYCSDMNQCDFCIKDDDDRWQAAVNAAYGPDGVFGAVVGESGTVFAINHTITVASIMRAGEPDLRAEGTINGNGAELMWFGGDSIPMWKLVDTRHLQIEHLKVTAPDDEFPLDTAFEFSNPSGGYASSRNSLDHIAISAPAVDHLKYGIRFIEAGNDQNNDQSTISNTQILNVTEAAIRIEHSQSLAHRLINVYGTGAPGASGSRFIHLDEGSFTLIGGLQSGFSDAVYVLDAFLDRVTIIDSQSEASNRMVRADLRQNNPYPLHIIGGRFAIDDLASDGKVINYVRPGPVVIDGLRISDASGVPSDPAPVIHYDPQFTAGNEQLSSIQLTGCRFSAAGTSTYDVLSVGDYASVTAYGNSCAPSTGHSQHAPCKGLAGGVMNQSGVTYSELSAAPLSSLADGHSLYCVDCGERKSGQSAGICESGGSGRLAVRLNGGWWCD